MGRGENGEGRGRQIASGTLERYMGTSSLGHAGPGAEADSDLIL